MNASALEIRVSAPLAGFDLDVEIATNARCLGIFGPSGSGKTSLLEAIAGWRPVRAGRIRLGDRALFDAARGLEASIPDRALGYVPQESLLFPHWTVRRNVLCGPRATEADLARAAAMLEIGALLDRSTSTLSGGEKSRVALARALCSRPDALLLDEPFGSLDVPLRRRILPYFLRARDAYDLPMIFVSHDTTEVQALCDVVAVLERGRVRAIGPAAEVLQGRSLERRGYENVLSGPVVALGGGTAQVEIAPGVTIQVPGLGLRVGDSAVFALGADDILVSIAPVAGISARNLVPARIDAVEARAEEVVIRTSIGEKEPARILVGLTEASTRELDLRAGASIVLVFKTQSCRVLSAGTVSADAAGEPG